MDGHFDTLNRPADSLTFYFPAKLHRKDTVNDAIDSIRNAWYSRILFAMKEPMLCMYRGDMEIYRFTWLRTFHHPIVVRIEKKGTYMRLHTKVANGQSGYATGRLITDKVKEVTTGEWKEFTSKLESAGIWHLATSINDMGLDGAEWIIEAVTNGKYHVVDRYSPLDENMKSFSDIGKYLLELAPLKDEMKVYY